MPSLVAADAVVAKLVCCVVVLFADAPPTAADIVRAHVFSHVLGVVVVHVDAVRSGRVACERICEIVPLAE